MHYSYQSPSQISEINDGDIPEALSHFIDRLISTNRLYGKIKNEMYIHVIVAVIEQITLLLLNSH